MNMTSWWQSLSARERRLLVTAAILVLTWVLWAFALQPALRTWRGAPAQLEAARGRVAQVESLAAEAARIRGLSSATTSGTMQAPRGSGGLDAQLRDALVQALGQDARVDVQGRVLVLQFQQARPEGLKQALKTVRSRLKVRLTEAELVPVESGMQGRVQFEWLDG